MSTPPRSVGKSPVRKTFRLSRVRYLKKTDLNRIPIEYVTLNGLNEEEEKSLRDQKFIIGSLNTQEEEKKPKENYTIVHGLPEDVATGIIFESQNRIVAIIGDDCKDENDFTHWYKRLPGALAEVFLPDEEKECMDCGLYYIGCDHVEEGTCQGCPTDKNDVVLRGKCIFCLFEGKEWQEDWDHLFEVLADISLGVYKLGRAQARKGKPIFPCTSEDGDVKALYRLYRAGHKMGVLEKRLGELTT